MPQFGLTRVAFGRAGCGSKVVRETRSASHLEIAVFTFLEHGLNVSGSRPGGCIA
jgi:hypothetical protein